MATRWKIFKLANIVEIIIISALIMIGMYNSPFQPDNRRDYFVFTFFVSLPVITTVNCIGNVLLANHSSTGKKLSPGRKIFNWFFFAAFLGILILIGFALVNIYIDYTSRSTPLDQWQVAVTWAMIALLLIGIYIVVMQVKLYALLKKKYIEGNLLMIEELGKDQNG